MKRGCLISFFSLLAFVAIFELVARSGWVAALRPEALDPIGAQVLEANVQAHPYLAYAPKPNYRHEPTPSYAQQVSHNSLGFRGRETTYAKPQGTFRIVTIGGSSVYGQSESRDDAVWSVRMEKYLNEAGLARKVEVINGGCRGYSTFEMLINLELRLVDFEPDLVLVYESINDMRCALYPGCRNDNQHWRTVWPVVRKSAIDELAESSRLYLTWRRYGTDWLTKQGNLGSYVIVDFGKYADDYAQPTDAERGFANFRRNLKSIVSVAREHGSQVLLSTQAMRFSDIEPASSYQAQKAGLLRCREILREVASSEGVPLVDTAKHLEDALADQLAAGKKPDDLFQHEVHPTDKGSDMIGRFLADRILELKLVPAN
ncbi:MAG: SGNH/GDSL hydrolase family protein [Planctomycetes bacterium]|nr:SGNH/GDSL hydrolase family protein [Planctomycetota bacterium]